MFGKKRKKSKKRSDKGKANVNSLKDSSKRLIRRASYVSTPVRPSRFMNDRKNKRHRRDNVTSYKSSFHHPKITNGIKQNNAMKRKPQKCPSYSQSEEMVQHYKCKHVDRNNIDQASLQKWLAWRTNVNSDLISHILTDTSKACNVSSPKMIEFNSSVIDSVLNQMYYQEEPKTVLDNLSFIIYGLPRIVLTNTNKIPDRSRHFKLGKGNIQGNLYIQKNPLHNIPRYLPPVSHYIPEADYPDSSYSSDSLQCYSMEYKEDSFNVWKLSRKETGTNGNRISVLTKDSNVSASYNEYRRVNTEKPPIAGAVPTLLSGLTPNPNTRLRHVIMR